MNFKLVFLSEISKKYTEAPKDWKETIKKQDTKEIIVENLKKWKIGIMENLKKSELFLSIINFQSVPINIPNKKSSSIKYQIFKNVNSGTKN